MDLTRKMTRAEVRDLSDLDKKERKRLQNIKANKKYRENHPEKSKEYIDNNKDKLKEKNRKQYEQNREKYKERSRQYRKQNPEKSKEYYKNNKEELSKYYQTPIGKKVNTLSKWKTRDLKETEEELDIIYELYLTQELCYSCDVKLTRDGVCSTQACMDHDHNTHKFRQICCRSCNNKDRWMQYWC